MAHANQRGSRPGLAHCRAHGATDVQGARSEDLDALALRATLAYRAGGCS